MSRLNLVYELSYTRVNKQNVRYPVMRAIQNIQEHLYTGLVEGVGRAHDRKLEPDDL